jgi:predicted nucleotidyltransferase
MNKKEIEQKITDYLFNYDEILISYLFGSFVSKKYFHDIDIAVYLRNNFNKNDFKKYPFGYESEFSSNLSHLLKIKVDFLVLNDTEILFQQRVINNGKILFSKDDKFRIYYENHIRKLYIDLEPVRKIHNFYLNQKILNA